MTRVRRSPWKRIQFFLVIEAYRIRANLGKVVILSLSGRALFFLLVLWSAPLGWPGTSELASPKLETAPAT